MNEANTTALVLDPADNVATLLSDSARGTAVMLKGAAGTIVAADTIPFGHKIAIAPIEAGEPVRKYGQIIGCATRDIASGEWVHLQNMQSAIDGGFRKRIER
jgi:altronate dehydratase small subunit